MQCSQELHFINIIAFSVPFSSDLKQLYSQRTVFKNSAGSVQQNTKIKLILVQQTSQCATLLIYSKIYRADFFSDKKGICISICYVIKMLFFPSSVQTCTFFLHSLLMIHKMIIQTFKQILQESYEDLGKQSKYTSTVNNLCLWHVFICYVIYGKNQQHWNTVPTLSALAKKPNQNLPLLKDGLTFVLKRKNTRKFNISCWKDIHNRVS